MHNIKPGFYWYRISSRHPYKVIEICPPNNTTGNQLVIFPENDPQNCTHLLKGDIISIDNPNDC